MSAVGGPAAESENRCWSLLKGYAANDVACPERPTSWLAKAQRPGASQLANGEIAFAGVRSHASSSTFPREPQMVWADKVRWGVEGRERSKALKTAKLADSFRSLLAGIRPSAAANVRRMNLKRPAVGRVRRNLHKVVDLRTPEAPEEPLLAEEVQARSLGRSSDRQIGAWTRGLAGLQGAEARWRSQPRPPRGYKGPMRVAGAPIVFWGCCCGSSSREHRTEGGPGSRKSRTLTRYRRCLDHLC